MMEKKTLSDMTTAFGQVKECLITAIEKDFNESNEEALMIFLNAYNEWQESERDGVDYIFNINNQDDLLCVVNGGMTAKEIGFISYYAPYGFFLFGCNYPTPKMFDDTECLKNTLLAVDNEVVEFVLTYPFLPQAQHLYEYYISNNIDG
jgi:hypothetical protein